MAVFRAFNDRRQYFDTNGNPLSGGFVFWYLAGTTTKQNTYNSSAGSVANSNPMTLDSAGRFASEVWLTGGVSYKMVITASTDTTDPPNSPIWTEDNIRGIDDPGTTITGEWIVSNMTPTYISASSFSVPGDQTSILHVGRRLQITDAGGTKYATILTSTFGAITTLTLTVDNSGSLSNPVSSFNYGIVSAVNTSNPFTVFQNILPRSLAPNPFFEVDQLANSATSVSDDNYGHDHWYVLTQTASIQVSTQTLQENGMTANARLTQNQAAAQRMGYACIIEAKEAQKLRGQTMTFKPRIRCSSSQAIRCAVLEWTGTADSVTSDVVNDWTSSDYTDGAARFFVDANLTPLGTSAVTPSAATWTDATQLPVTVSSSCNNLILFVWTEGTAAQNVTLDIGKVRFVPGNYTIGDIYIPTFEETLRYAMRFYEKSFPYLTAPAQAGGYTGSEVIIQAVGAAVANQSSYRIPFKVNKRNASPTLTLFNPLNANAQAVNSGISTDCTLTASGLSDDSSFYFTYTTAAGSAAGQSNRLHWTAAVRL